MSTSASRSTARGRFSAVPWPRSGTVTNARWAIRSEPEPRIGDCIPALSPPRALPSPSALHESGARGWTLAWVGSVAEGGHARQPGGAGMRPRGHGWRTIRFLAIPRRRGVTAFAVLSSCHLVMLSHHLLGSRHRLLPVPYVVILRSLGAAMPSSRLEAGRGNEGGRLDAASGGQCERKREAVLAGGGRGHMIPRAAGGGGGGTCLICLGRAGSRRPLRRSPPVSTPGRGGCGDASKRHHLVTFAAYGVLAGGDLQDVRERERRDGRGAAQAEAAQTRGDIDERTRRKREGRQAGGSTGREGWFALLRARLVVACSGTASVYYSVP
ncbi:hypothetical protein BD779DRAFT_1466556 [Infundibulicybe gibba]|nr:hypothetical protein BD779DRAFT_1466556 [Infundibulicybe gibba]